MYENAWKLCSLYSMSKRKYNLYKKNNHSPSSFIKEKYYNRLNFKDNLYHKGKILVSDYNNNEVEIEFTFLSDEIRNTEFNLIKKQNGFLLEYQDSTIQDINIELADRFHDGLYHKNIPIERISEGKYFVRYPNFKFDIIASYCSS